MGVPLNTITIDFPAPPVEAIMPALAQSVALYLSLTILAVVSVMAVRMSARQKTLLPVLLLISGSCTIVLEPIIAHLGHAFHPEIGSIALFKTNNVTVPVYLAILHPCYFGSFYIVLFSRIVNDNFTGSYLWKAYFITCVLNYLIEILPVSSGLWVYYDPQALWLWKGGMPLWWTFVNAGCLFVPVALIHFLYPILKGWKQLLVIVLSPLGIGMGWFGAAFPANSVYNSSASQKPFLVELSGLASVGLAILVTFICIQVLTGRRIATSEAGS